MKTGSKETIKKTYFKAIVKRMYRLEQERRALWYKLLLVNGAIAGLFYLMLGNQIDLPMQMHLVLVSIMGVVSKFLSRDFVQKFKKSVIRKLFSSIMEDCVYEPHSSMPESEFRQSQFTTEAFDRYEGEDLVQGKIGEIPIRFSEIKASKITRFEKGKEREHIIFKGLFFSFKLAQSLNQKTLILVDEAEGIFGKQVGRYLQKQSRNDLGLVQLESVVFEKLFAVYSDDQIKARVLLSPQTMQNILNFKTKYKESVEISIIHDEVFIAIRSNKNFFEPKLFGKIISFTEVREIYDLMALVSELKGHLKLNVKAS